MKRISGFISSLKEVYLGTLTSEDESEPFDQYEVLPYSNQQAKKDKKHKDKDKEHKDGKEKDKQKHIGKKLNDAFERQMEKIEKKLMKKKVQALSSYCSRIIFARIIQQSNLLDNDSISTDYC